jgi:MFS family permease
VQIIGLFVSFWIVALLLLGVVIGVWALNHAGIGIGILAGIAAVCIVAFPTWALGKQIFELVPEKKREYRIASQRSRQQSQKNCSLSNGWLMVITSPIMLVLAVGSGIEEVGGILGTVFGVLVGAAWFGMGVFSIRRSRQRQMPERWLELQRFAIKEAANSKQPQGAASPDRSDD